MEDKEERAKEMEKLLDIVFYAYERMSKLTGRRIMNFDVYPENRLALVREAEKGERR